MPWREAPALQESAFGSVTSATLQAPGAKIPLSTAP